MKPELTSTQLAQKRKNSLDSILPSGGFVIFPHFLHRSLSLFDFLPLFPVPPDLEAKLFRENLHLSPRAQLPLAKCLQGFVALYAPLWQLLAPFPVPAEPSFRWVSASITAHLATLRSMAEYGFPGSFGASKSVISCTLLMSLIPPVTVFRDCITVSLDGELPAACNSLRSVSHCLNVNNSFVLSRQGTGLANLS